VTAAPASRPQRHFVIAIDGPAGAGKSTIARMLASRLRVPYLDTGAMYRAVGLLARRAGMTPPFTTDDGPRLASLVGGHQIEVCAGDGTTIVTIDGEDVSTAIRAPECSTMASAVSAVSAVRQALVPLQRDQARRHGGVLEGRDIGTVVVPDADLKVFLTATAGERAVRRQRDLALRGIGEDLEAIRREQQERDHRDSSRADSPLKVAEGSLVVDTTVLSPEEVIDRILLELSRTGHRELDTPGGTP
jgi:cytidylate kinase